MATDMNPTNEQQLIDPFQVSFNNEEEFTNRKSYLSAPVTLIDSPRKSPKKLIKEREDIVNKV